MTKTEEIAQAVAATLRGAGLSVRDDTEQLFSYEDFPAIVVEVGSETPRPVVGVGFVYWDLSLTLLIGAVGPSPTLAPESTRATAHAALYADRTLGGRVIDLVTGTVSRRIDEENPALGIAEVTFNIQYRQQEGQV